MRRTKRRFGALARRLSVLRRQAEHSALYAALGPKSVAEQAMEVANYVQSRCGDIGLGIQLAKGLDKRRNTQKSHKVAEAQAVLTSYGDHGASDVDFLVSNIPSLSSQSLRATPFPHARRFQVQPSDHQRAATQGCAYACANRRANLGVALQQHWDDQHQIIQEQQCPALKRVAANKSQCASAGVCVCSGAGRELQRFRARVMKVMKGTLFKEPSLKRLLSQGSVCMHLASDSQDWWLQVAMMYYKPVRPTYHLLEPVDVEGPLPVGAGGMRSLQAMVLSPREPQLYPEQLQNLMSQVQQLIPPDVYLARA